MLASAGAVQAHPAFVLVAIPTLLILLRVTYVHARQVTTSRSSKKHSMSYVVKWGRERLHFPLPPPDTKLGEVRRVLAEYTQLPPQTFKLIHAGAVMKDDNAPLSAYGIKPNSTIALIGGNDPLPAHSHHKAHKHHGKAKERTEANTVAQIRGELDAVRQTLKPDVDHFLNALDSTSLANAGAQPPAPATKAKPQSASKQEQLGGRNPDLEQEHARLGELLLQVLLRLDAITAEGEWEEARQERKGAVREVQALLDRLDGGWRARTRKSAEART